MKALLEPFGITRYHTDYWGAYTRHLDPAEHNPGKRNREQGDAGGNRQSPVEWPVAVACHSNPEKPLYACQIATCHL